MGSLGSQGHRGPRTRCRCPGGGPGPSHRGPGGKGRRWPPGPLSGAAPCRQPGERFLLPACCQTQTRKSSAGALHVPLSHSSSCVSVCLLLAPSKRVRAPGPAGSREAGPSWALGHRVSRTHSRWDGSGPRSVRTEGRHRPQRGAPGPSSSGTGALRPGDALFLGLPPSPWTTRGSSRLGKTPGIFHKRLHVLQRQPLAPARGAH